MSLPGSLWCRRCEWPAQLDEDGALGHSSGCGPECVDELVLEVMRPDPVAACETCGATTRQCVNAGGEPRSTPHEARRAAQAALSAALSS